MILRGLDFGPVWGASGVQGFFGEGYPFHKLLGPFGPDFRGMTFVAKTTTTPPREGNMPLKEDGITPRSLAPSCVKVNFWRGAALNAVGLSGPGARALLKSGRWQARVRGKRPFFLSWASTAKTRMSRLQELRLFVELLRVSISGHFSPVLNGSARAPFGLQLNFSCPNTGRHAAPEWEALLEEIRESLAIASVLGIPLVPKISVLFPPEIAKKISEYDACDALCVSNTVPWGEFPHEISWKKLFGSHESPLAHLGGGGLSGAPIFPLVAEWLYSARKIGIQKPICAGGGILSWYNIAKLYNCGASAISLGSVAILRPWRVQGLIRHAHLLFSRSL